MKICLANHQKRTTLTKTERDHHLAAGLGPKEVTFTSINDSYASFYATLVEAFPQVADVGGFLLYRASSGGNGVHPIDTASMKPCTSKYRNASNGGQTLPQPNNVLDKRLNEGNEVSYI